jgi:hypothetical protein
MNPDPAEGVFVDFSDFEPHLRADQPAATDPALGG